MVEDLEIPKATLGRIRKLNDRDLVRLLKDISEHSWAKAEATLQMLEAENVKR